jgi:type I restriction enzyme M protein
LYSFVYKRTSLYLRSPGEDFEFGPVPGLGDFIPGVGGDEALFSTPYAALAEEDIEAAIRGDASVQGFRASYEAAFADFAALLKTELVDGMTTLDVNKEENKLAAQIFARLADIPLVDRYSVYQVLDDEWAKTAVDLEIIQTEGFAATKKTDPNMVLKKKEGKDQEAQDGWVGHVIPFELVQATLLKDEADALHAKEDELAEITDAFEEIIDSLSEEDKEGDFVNEAKDAFVNAEVAKRIKADFGTLAKAKTAVLALDEDAVERKLVRVQELIDSKKALKAAIKRDTEALHLKTKATIEGLTDAQALELLEQKWITPLMTAIHRTPDGIVADLVAKVRALADKYATTYAEVAGQIADTKSSLSALIDGLTGDEYDMKGLAEFQALLRGENHE